MPAPETAEELLENLYKVWHAAAEKFNREHRDTSFQFMTEPPYIVAPAAVFPGVAKSSQRCIVASPYWALMGMTAAKQVKVYLLPSVELLAGPESAAVSRLRMRLSIPKKRVHFCEVDDNGIAAEDFPVVVSSTFNDLLKRSVAEASRIIGQADEIGGDQSMISVVKSLVREKQRLLDCLVTEQERVRQQIAAEIHDVVLGDLFLMQKQLKDGKAVDTQQFLELTSNATAYLRTLCADLYPRDIEEWGLKVVLQDLGARFSRRTGTRFDFDCPGDIPELPLTVQMHVYRIVQECIRNCEKHAHANSVRLSVVHDGSKNLMRLTVADDGRGSEALKNGLSNFGTTIMHERAELISRWHPCRLMMNSRVGKGTEVALEINVKPAWLP